jgi:hypothetical protein
MMRRAVECLNTSGILSLDKKTSCKFLFVFCRSWALRFECIRANQ